MIFDEIQTKRLATFALCSAAIALILNCENGGIHFVLFVALLCLEAKRMFGAVEITVSSLHN